jgi:hypothetical protein
MSGYDGGQWWGAPTDLGGDVLAGELSAVSAAPHEIDVFYTNSYGELMQSQWRGGPWWSGGYHRAVYPGGGSGALSASEVYVRGPNGNLSVVHP